MQEFTFDNPNGENVFLPLSTGSKKQQTCLVYTNAYGKKDNGVIELLYEINFENMQDFQDQAADGAEDIPGITWSCAAYNVGNGWFGLKGEEKSE